MDEIKDKITLAVKKAITNRAEVVDCYHDIMEIDCNDVDHIAEEVVDALVAANIDDMTVHEAETEYWKTICKIESDEHRTAIKNAAEHARHLMQERDEYKHRVEVAERALATVCEEVLHARYPVEYVTVSVVEDFIQLTLKDAEKELAEEKK